VQEDKEVRVRPSASANDDLESSFPEAKRSHNLADERLAVSANEAARLCGIGRTSIYRALSTGELKSLKIHKRRLITLDALRAWLASHEVAL
jgi:excisionase family DNA binding protein